MPYTTSDPINLSLMTCFYADFQEARDRTYCSYNDSSHCVRCPILGQFVTGESMNDYSGRGHVISYTLSIIGFIIGILGILSNSFIIFILAKMNSKSGFDTLLMALAWSDLFCSLSAVITAISKVVYFQNYNRGMFNMYILHIFSLSVIFGRSLSSFMTVLIALERYLVIVFPLKAKEWFTQQQCRIKTAFVIIFSILMAIPRFVSVYVRENDIGKDIDGMKNFRYIFYATRFEHFWYVTLGGFFDLVDFWLPLPLLLLLNGLIYYQIRQLEVNRKKLNLNLKRDISAAKMFGPVAIILFLCNIEPIVYYFYIAKGTIYREHYSGVLVSLTINAIVNLPIYYARAQRFRQEARKLLHNWFPNSEKFNEITETGGS